MASYLAMTGLLCWYLLLGYPYKLYRKGWSAYYFAMARNEAISQAVIFSEIIPNKKEYFPHFFSLSDIVGLRFTYYE